MIGPSEIGLEQAKALAGKALAALGEPLSLTEPADWMNERCWANRVRTQAVSNNWSAPTAKAKTGDVKTQRVLGQFYQYGNLTSDGSAGPRDCRAAYWYRQASDHGDAQAAYGLAILLSKWTGRGC